MGLPVLAYVACAIIWGTTWFAIRVCIGAGGYPTYAASALRFTIAALVLVAIWRARRLGPGPRTRAEWAWLAVAGLFNAVGYGLVYTAEESLPGGLAAVLFGTFPLFTAIAAALTRTERASAQAIAGSLVALGGITVIFWDRLAVSWAQATAVLLMLAAVMMSTFYNIIFKRKAGELHPLASTGVFLSVTALAQWAFVAVAEHHPLPWPPPVAPTVALLYLAIVGSVIAFGSYFYLMKHVRLMTLTSLVFVQPLLALGADALWEEQVRIVPRTYVGAGIVLVGVLVSVLRRQTSVRR